MLRDQIVALIKENVHELKRFDVKAIYLFGSVARGEENPQSDIDILVTFNEKSTFDNYMELKFFLENLFLKKVDLVTEQGLRPELRPFIQKDLIHAA